MKFNWIIYKEFNMDLEKAGLKTPMDYINHYIKHGKQEGRNYRLCDIYILYPELNLETYRKSNVELLKLSKEQLEYKWLFHGRYQDFNKKINSNIYEFIDKILFINLDFRKDRLEELQKEMKRIEIPKDKIIHIDAIYNKLGALGCTRSHIKAIEYGKENKYKTIWILEDDVNFIVNNEAIHRNMEVIRNFLEIIGGTILLLSGNIIKTSNYNEHIDKAINVLTTSSYIVTENMYEPLLEVLKESEKILESTGNIEKGSCDVLWNKIENRYILKERLCYQRDSYSNVINKLCSYKT